MDSNKLKINFTISRSVNSSIENLNSKILEELKKENYQISPLETRNISFNNYGTPLFRIRGSSSRKLREGVFTLVEQNSNVLVKLKYRIPILTLAIMSTILLFLGFLWGWGVVFIFGIFAIGFVSELFQQKDNAKRLLNLITE